MKRLMMVSTVFFCMLFIAPVWAHHPAEGIVSDEIWQMVDGLLEGSPHLDIDFDNIMDSMGTVEDSDGRISLVTTIVVNVVDVDDQEVSEEDYLAAIEEVMVKIDEAIADMNSIPSASGKTDNRTGPLVSFEVMPIDPDELDEEIVSTEILLYEPVGSGESQDGVDPMNPDAKKRR